MNRAGSQDLLLFLHQIEGDILKHAEDEDDSWAASLFFERAMSTTMEERCERSRKREHNTSGSISNNPLFEPLSLSRRAF